MRLECFKEINNQDLIKEDADAINRHDWVNGNNWKQKQVRLKI